MNKKTLFLGGSSLLAHAWCSSIKNSDEIILGIHHRKPELEGFKLLNIDFSSPNKIKKIISDLDLDVIINCVGYTNVENCEINPDQANILNVEYPSVMAKISKENSFAIFKPKSNFEILSLDTTL